MLKIIKNDRIYSNSLIFFTASLLGGFGNYVFHALAARLLLPSGYGELQSLISLSVIFGIPVGVLSVVITKYTAEFKAKNENQKIYFLFKNFTKKFLTVGLIFFIILFLAAPFISNFLSLKSLTPLTILLTSFIFVFLTALNNSILQGLEKFKDLSLISIVSVIFKIVLAFILIKLSFAVAGVIGAIVLAGLLAYGLTFIPLRFLTKFASSPRESVHLPIRQMLCFSAPVFFTILFTTLLYNLDILLVKHFFSPAVAGQYAALALLGHIIFFVVGPLATVMFPAASAAHAFSATGHEDKTTSSVILQKSFFMSTVVGLIALIFYFTFPAFIIKIIIGANYLGLSPYLGWFALSMFLFSLISLLSQYFLSISRARFAFILGASVLLQIIFIAFWHQTLWQIVWIMNGVMAACLVGLLLDYKFLLKHDNTRTVNMKTREQRTLEHGKVFLF